eukprot:CAMPEP_0119366580 /NCGR_PEP_ID=MMETSP1334-20130426/13436_1 /TAXON_ID=127549 /ORGANISM="Calcidiscus leptoporus, Strain RCC1130" /LENGTH=95 /DNA_ID=CAMNT_0007382819 /DNA_START=962 /DNA_END=1250 /DNA_ORIENTATION=-
MPAAVSVVMDRDALTPELGQDPRYQRRRPCLGDPVEVHAVGLDAPEEAGGAGGGGGLGGGRELSVRPRVPGAAMATADRAIKGYTHGQPQCEGLT